MLSGIIIYKAKECVIVAHVLVFFFVVPENVNREGAASVFKVAYKRS